MVVWRKARTVLFAWMLLMAVQSVDPRKMIYYFDIFDLVESYEWVNYTADSKLQCAGACIREKCKLFIHEGNECQTAGRNLAPEALALYFMTVYFVPPAGPTEASTNYNDITMHSMAVDDDDTTFWMNSEVDPKPWWRMDLQQDYLIRVVSIYPRQDKLMRFNNFKVYVGNSSSVDSDVNTWELFANVTGPSPEKTGVRFNFEKEDGYPQVKEHEKGIAGSKILIQKIAAGGQTHLDLPDVKVIVREIKEL